MPKFALGYIVVDLVFLEIAPHTQLKTNMDFLFFKRLVVARALIGLFCCTVFAVCGCEKSPPPSFRFNSVELLKLEKTKLGAGEHFDSAYREQIANLVTALFGTPDEPRFPFLKGENDPSYALVSLKNLEQAAGAVGSDRAGSQKGLYREHCAQCHGITGDGAGPTALTLNPYPRDFRLGKFKFKSTPLRKPPTDEDLTKIIRNGIPGTAMPSFKVLPDEEIAALVDYVKYLTIRGEFERTLLAEASNRDGEPLFLIPAGFDPSIPDAKIPKELEDQLFELVGDYLNDQILARWIERDDAVTIPPPLPKEFDLQSPEFTSLALKGQQLFASKANCIQCHGQTGLGDGQVGNFDDWTNDWLKSPGIDVTQPASFADFLAQGALPPRSIRPRNLNFPIYRGGGELNDLFLRVKNGIEGTPMPSSVILTDDEIWSIVAFIKSLPYRDQ